MKTFIALLRGINVSGTKRMKMDALVETFKKSGFIDISTYVQSGNVVFKANEELVDIMTQRLQKQIQNDFKFEVPLIILSVEQLKNIIDNNPFAQDNSKDHTFLHVTFLFSGPKSIDKKAITEKIQGNEEIFFTDNAIYLYCPQGYGQTNLNNNFLEKKLKLNATTRNWKTTLELKKMTENV